MESRQMTGGEALVEALISQGIELVFGLPGAQLDPIFAAFHDRQDRIRIIHPRHEQGCAYMAYGYGQAGGGVGTLLVVPGPGLFNAGAGMVTGYACNTPMLCIAGQGRSHLIGRGFGVLHEIPDQLELGRGMAKSAEKIETGEEIPEKIANAFGLAMSGRRRPTYLEVPLDITQANLKAPARFPTGEDWSPPQPDSESIELAARALAEANCPLIIAGGGAVDAGEELRAIAELLGAPLAMSQNGLGTIDCRHPLAFTQNGAHKWWAKADVVLAVGTRLFPANFAWGRDEDMRIIKIDIDDQELHRLPGPIDGIHGDARQVSKVLLEALQAKSHARRADRSLAFKEVREAVAASLAPLQPLTDLLMCIRRALGEDGVLVSDLTQLYFAAQDAYPVYQPRSYIHPSYQGTLGHAVATSLGVKLAVGERPVISLSGDGGFMFTVQELATAVQHAIDVTFLVMNDGAFGNVKRILRENYGNRVIGANLQNPDLVKLAESFGMSGRRVRDAASLEVALGESLSEPGPGLVEYQAPEFPSPWPLHFLPQVRGGSS